MKKRMQAALGILYRIERLFPRGVIRDGQGGKDGSFV